MELTGFPEMTWTRGADGRHSLGVLDIKCCKDNIRTTAMSAGYILS